jgi:hypothetical protein
MLENKDITPLLRTSSPGSVSIYMGTDPGNRVSREDMLRLRNMLRQAESELGARDLSASDVQAITEPGWAMLDNELFWSRQEGGLAMFLAPRSYSHQRLPEDPGDRLYVDTRFHIRPLVEFLDRDRTYYVLALSLSGFTLYRNSGSGLEDVRIKGDTRITPPASRSPEDSRSLQFHTGTPGARGSRPALYHGHGSTQQAEQEAVLAYFREVNTTIGPLLADEDAPMVLAGVRYLWPLYREVSTYPFVLEDGVEGSPDAMSLEEIHARSRVLVQPVFDEERVQALALFSDVRGTPAVREDLGEVLRAAYDGRVELLLVAAGHRCHGAFDPATRRVERDAGDVEGSTELLNLASIYTLLRGGRVINVLADELGDDGLAALLRY